VSILCGSCIWHSDALVTKSVRYASSFKVQQIAHLLVLSRSALEFGFE